MNTRLKILNWIFAFLPIFIGLVFAKYTWILLEMQEAFTLGEYLILMFIIGIWHKYIYEDFIKEKKED